MHPLGGSGEFISGLVCVSMVMEMVEDVVVMFLLRLKSAVFFLLVFLWVYVNDTAQHRLHEKNGRHASFWGGKHFPPKIYISISST